MKVLRLLLIGTCLAILFVGCTSMKPMSSQGDRQDVLYTCNCGPQCQCNTVSTQPGKCACGAPLKWGHVVKIEGSEAIL